MTAITIDQNLISQTKEAILEAGKIIIRNWDKPGQIRHKGRIDLVTDTDLAVEDKLKSSLKDILPQATFLAEGSANQTKPGNLTWIIDPLDGTTNFAHRIPFVAISVALWAENSVLMGFVHLPILEEMFWAAHNKGAFLKDQKISVSTTSELEQSLVATGFPYSVREDIDEIMNYLKKVLVSSRGVRRPGSAAIDLAYVACGRYDAFYELNLKPWDTAAGLLLVQEAGGKVSTFSGKPYTPGNRQILATNGYVHQAMIDILNFRSCES